MTPREFVSILPILALVALAAFFGLSVYLIDPIDRVTLSTGVIEVGDYDGSYVTIPHGSGFWVDRHTMVSNWHVVRPAVGRKPRVLFPNGSYSKYRVLARNEYHDLVIIRTERPSNNYLAGIRCDRGADLGERLWSVGHPLAMRWIRTTGHAAIVGRDDARYQVMTGAFMSGHSGGPVVDEWGNLVGVIKAVFLKGTAGGLHLGPRFRTNSYVSSYGLFVRAKHVCALLRRVRARENRAGDTGRQMRGSRERTTSGRPGF